MPPRGYPVWISTADAYTLFTSSSPSKLASELARGMNPNQALEMPSLDKTALPRGGVDKTWPRVSEEQRRRARVFQQEMLMPVHGLSDQAAEEVAQLQSRWGWDPSWDDCVPYPPGEEGPSSSSGGGGGGAGGTWRGVSESQWPLVLVACLVGHSPQLLERLLKAGADPNAVHGRTGMTALMCLVQNDRLGPAAKREAVQLLAKAGCNRWGAVRRDSCVDAVVSVVQDVVTEQHILRSLLLEALPPSNTRTTATPAATGAGGRGASAGAAAATGAARGRTGAVGGRAGGGAGRQTSGGSAGGGRGVGGSGGGGAGGGGGGVRGGFSGSDPKAAAEECKRRVRDAFELLDELLRRRCWPPARGSPPYVSIPLLKQLGLSLAMLDAAAPRLVEAMAGVHAGETGMGPCSNALRSLMKEALEWSDVEMCNSRGRIAAMRCPALLRRVVAAGVRLDEPACPGGGLQCLVEPHVYTDPRAMSAALGAGMSPHLVPAVTAGPTHSPPWGSLLAEVVAEGYPEEVLKAVLEAGADPRAAVLGCIRPLALAALAHNTGAYQALLRAGAQPEDCPPLDQSPPRAAQEPMAVMAAAAPGAAAGAGGGGGLQRGRHPTALRHGDPVELIESLPLLADPCPTAALTLLAAFRCANSLVLRRHQQARAAPAEGASGSGCWWQIGSGHAVDLGGGPADLASDFIRTHAACLYLPYLLETLPYLLKAVVLGNPQLCPLLVAPIKALADRVDSPAPASPASAATDPTSTGAGPDLSPCGAAGSPGQDPQPQPPSPWQAPPSSPSSPSSLDRRPDWPVEAEVPSEVVGAMLTLPAVAGAMLADMETEHQGARSLCDCGYTQAALRLASALLRDQQASLTAPPSAPPTSSATKSTTTNIEGYGTSGSSPASTSTATTTRASGAARAATATTTAGSTDRPTLATRRWRLVACVFNTTLPAIYRGRGRCGDALHPLTWLPQAVLLLYGDPWVRALMANATLDAISKATHDAAATTTTGAAASSSSSSKSAPPASAGTIGGSDVNTGGGGTANGRSGNGSSAAGTTFEATAVGRAAERGSRAVAELRLARCVEGEMRQAVAAMSRGYSCPLVGANADAGLAQIVGAVLEGRRQAAMAGSAPVGQAAAVTGEGKGAGRGGMMGGEKDDGSGIPDLVAAALASYGPYNGRLAGVPYWVQASVSLWGWELLVGLQQLLRESGSGLAVARELLEARERLGPSLAA